MTNQNLLLFHLYSQNVLLNIKRHKTSAEFGREALCSKFKALNLKRSVIAKELLSIAINETYERGKENE